MLRQRGLVSERATINTINHIVNADAPAWFRDAVAAPRISHVIEVGSTHIHYDVWDNNPEKKKPGLLLIHGHAAQRHWWDFIAPQLARLDEGYRVVAMDTSGSGDSDHRPEYQMRYFATEVFAVIEHAELNNCTVVGHSFGGSIGRVATYIDRQNSDHTIRGLVCVDTSISRSKTNRIGSHGGDRGNRAASRPKPIKQRYYKDLSEGARRFRLRPPQPCDHGFLLDYIAKHSLQLTANGYCYKLDQRLFEKMPGGENLPPAAEMLADLNCPTGYIYGERSRFFSQPEQLSLLSELIPAEHTRSVSRAYHHVFLDQPQAFCDALNSLLKCLN